MAYLQESLFAVSLFLLVLLGSGYQTGDEGVTFNLDDKIEEHSHRMAKKFNNYLTWWDSKGTHPTLKKEYPRYKKYKVTSTASRLKFSQARQESVRIKNLISQDMENKQQAPSKILMKKTSKHIRASSWNAQKSFSSESEYFFKFSFPKNLISLGASHTHSTQEKNSSGQSINEIEEIVIEKNFTVMPGTKVKATWTIRENIQVLPWKAEVISRGWFAVYYYYRHGARYLWMYPICSIEDNALESNCTTETEDGGFVKFLASGMFTGIKSTELEVHVKEEKLKTYKGPPFEENVQVCR